MIEMDVRLSLIFAAVRGKIDQKPNQKLSKYVNNDLVARSSIFLMLFLIFNNYSLGINMQIGSKNIFCQVGKQH